MSRAHYTIIQRIIIDLDHMGGCLIGMVIAKEPLALFPIIIVLMAFSGSLFAVDV